jgi:zinc protease
VTRDLSRQRSSTRAIAGLCALSLLLAACATETPLVSGPRESPGAEMVRGMRFPDLTMRIPRIGREVERLVLPNGIVLYLADDRSLPLLEAYAVFRAGSLYEEPASPAAARFMASQLRSGGTLALPSTALNEELEFLGASIEASASSEELTVNLSTLARNADRALQLFADIIRRPAFESIPLETAKGQTIEELRRLADNPGRLAAREFTRLLYTDAHPLGHPLTVAEVTATGRDELLRHHRRFVHPNNMFLAVAGDFSRPELLEMVRAVFGDWAPEPDFSLPELPALTVRSEPGLLLLPRPLAQATLLLGHVGTTRRNPDRYAIDLMDFLLGASGFSSRLMDRIRTREGLTYGVYSSFPTGSLVPSLFRVSLQTRNENIPRAIAAILEEMRRLQREPVSSEELERAKEAIVNSFVFRFSSRFGTLTRLLMLEIAGEPADFYDTLLDRYRRLTPDDIQRAARQYLRPEASTVVVVGDAPTFEAALAPFGPVRHLPPVTP